MSRLLDLKKVVELKNSFEKDFEADTAQTKLIDFYRAKVSEGHKPELLIGGADAINAFLKRHYEGIEPQWTKGVYILIDPEDETTLVRVLIANLKFNEIFLI